MLRVLKLKYLYSDWRGAFHTYLLLPSECRVKTRVNQTHRKMTEGARAPTTSKWHCWQEHHLPLANFVRPDDWLWFRWKPPLWSIRLSGHKANAQCGYQSGYRHNSFPTVRVRALLTIGSLLGPTSYFTQVGTGKQVLIYIDSTIPFTERNMPMSCCNILKWLLLFVCFWDRLV